jgi:hypothetical protein
MVQSMSRRHRPCLLLWILLATLLPASAAPATLSLEHRVWDASWIAHPDAPAHGYGVFRFRKDFELTAKPEHFVIHVSGDRRYRLFVNGVSVATGPQRGERYHWPYETLDIAPQLKPGRNVLASTVWNYGEDEPYAQESVRTGLIVQGATEQESVVNSDGSWHVYWEKQYQELPPDRAALRTFLVVGPGDRVDGRGLAWGWEQVSFKDTDWPRARALSRGTPEGIATNLTWWLVPRNIPLPFEREQRLSSIRRQEGAHADAAFLRGGKAWEIPPHTLARVLLDQGFETSAFPRLQVSGGKGATCRLTYAEALVDASGAKGNRDETDGREIRGIQDEFIADGGKDRVFSTLSFRTFRYLELVVQTQDEALSVEDLLGVATGYPFEEKGSFVSNDPRLSDVWTVGVRTARLCAYETYVDCPYYEQMQYVGDTRIQALVSLHAFGDDRLVRNAILQFDHSRLPCGLTQSRFPTVSPQIIPPFSLFWIAMVHDYWMQRPDEAFVRGRLAGVRSVLAWFEEHMDASTGLLGPLPYWNFVDWPVEWPWKDDTYPGGQPPGAREGGSTILSLQYAWALQQGSQLTAAFGNPEEAALWNARASRLLKAVRERCWDPRRRLYADTPAGSAFSQHANALAVLAGATVGDDARDLISRVRGDRSLIQCTLYFRFYLLRAAAKAGLADDYLASLGPWHDMISRGLSTFAERPDPTRSDCHAWSASPVYELLATVAGIEPAAPGFRRVHIEPHLGELTQLKAGLPHPLGLIEVSYQRDGAHLEAEITLPPALSGSFHWNGTSIPLHPGTQQLHL